MFGAGCGGTEVDFARSLAVKAPADLVLRGGKIVTVDKNFRSRSDRDQRRPLHRRGQRPRRPTAYRAGTRVIDLGWPDGDPRADRLAYPCDGGGHELGCRASLAVHAHACRRRSTNRRRDQDQARGSWIVVGGGWVPTQFRRAAFPDARGSGRGRARSSGLRSIFARRSAAQWRGACSSRHRSHTPDPAGGKFERNPKSGEFSGWLQGVPAWRFAYDKIPRPSLDAARQSLRNCFRELIGLGVTSIGDVQHARRHVRPSPTAGRLGAHRRGAVADQLLRRAR